MLTGQNGILTQAQKASEETEVASEKEAVSLAYTSAYTKNKGEGNVTDIQMQEALDENGTNANASGTGTLIVEFENGRTYMIDQNGNVTRSTRRNRRTRNRWKHRYNVIWCN